MPNIFAYVILIAWPIFSIFFYKKLDIITATFLTIVGGYMLLPVRVDIDLPLLPALDQNSIPALTSFLCCRFVKKINISLIPTGGAEKGFVIALLLLPFVTVMNNFEPVYNGAYWKSGLTLYDSISAILLSYLKILPFIIAVQVIKTHQNLMLIIKLLVMAGLCYSLLILFEIRMSPKLHTWIYGFFPHSWAQQARFGGFRAVVFMGHGLLVSMFIAICLACASINFKNKIKTFNIPPLFIVLYLFFVLIVSKSVGAFILGLGLMLCIMYMPNLIKKKVTLTIISLVILYPIFSMFGLFPHLDLLELVHGWSPERAQSLEFRFYHEMRLLEHAQQKLFFGWGAWGRNRLADSVTDGYWITILSSYGAMGFSLIFGLAAFCIYKALKVSTLATSKAEQALIINFALLIAIIMLDQIPNTSIYGWSWLLIGGLLGRANYLNQKAKTYLKGSYS